MLFLAQEEFERPSLIGSIVGSYKITSQIGIGGMGVVYEAEHILMGKRAAVKVLLPQMVLEKEVARRFENEAKATSKIRHPGIVEIFDYGFFGGRSSYIIMELLDGESLEERLERIGYLSVNDAINVTLHLADALGEAHRHGIVHRDLKPGNVFLVPDTAVAGGERAKILDFGVAKVSAIELASGTVAGQIIGTPGYLSPEQAKGWLEIDQRSDIYSLGCLFYKMLCGRTPFRGEGPRDVINAHIHTTPTPLHTRDNTIPEAVSELVSKLLEKNAEDRQQHMGEVIASLRAIQVSLYPSISRDFSPLDYSNEKTEPMDPLAFLPMVQGAVPTIDIDEELLSEIIVHPADPPSEASNQNVALSSPQRCITAEPYRTVSLRPDNPLFRLVALVSTRTWMIALAITIVSALVIQLRNGRSTPTVALPKPAPQTSSPPDSQSAISKEAKGRTEETGENMPSNTESSIDMPQEQDSNELPASTMPIRDSVKSKANFSKSPPRAKKSYKTTKIPNIVL